MQQPELAIHEPQDTGKKEEANKAATKRLHLRYRRSSRRNARRVPTAQKVRTFFRFFRWTFRWSKWLIVLPAFFLGCRYVWHHFTHDKAFGLRHVVFSQSHDMDVQEFLRTGDLRMGQNLLKINLAKTVQRIHKHPQIQRVRLQKKLPSTLWVELYTHQPIAVIDLGHPYLVSAAGIPYKMVSPEHRSKDLLKITGIRHGEYMAYPKAFQKIFRHALAVQTVYKDKGLSHYARLREIRVDRVMGYILVAGRTTVYLGQDRLPQRLDALQTVFKLFGRKGLSRLQTIHLNLEHHLRRAVLKPYQASSNPHVHETSTAPS